MDTTNDQHTADSGGQRTPAEVLADAIRALTEAARLRRPEMQRDAHGQWREHATDTGRADWAEFVTQALAGAAANVGSVEAALAGRPGSWEADAVRTLLHSTVGYDEQYLLEHRTEPLCVVVDIEQILSDLGIASLYDDAEAALDQMQADALATIDYSPYEWTFTPDADGHFVADDPQAPPWSIEAWRAGLDTEQLTPEAVHNLEQALTSGTQRASIVKSPDAARALARLAKQEDAIHADFRARFDALAAQRAQEWATYADAFAANIRREATRRYPGIPVRIDLKLTPDSAGGSDDDLSLDGLPEAHLVEFAARHTPLPGSGIAPKDYAPGTSIHAVETAAGRLPHLRLPTAAQLVDADTVDDSCQPGM